MSEQSGKVQTVLGLIEPDQLGRTMTHEHLTMTFKCSHVPPAPGDEGLAIAPIEMKHIHWLQQNPYSHQENLLLNQEIEAVKEELLCYRKAGGGSIVENTTTGITRNLPVLRQLAKETGVHVIAGAGYYVDVTHSDETRKMTVEKVGACGLVTTLLNNTGAFSVFRMIEIGVCDVDKKMISRYSRQLDDI